MSSSAENQPPSDLPEHSDTAEPQDLFEFSSPTPFPQTGSLPGSRRIETTLVRYQNPKYLALGPDLWQTFVDGPWKWELQQRYAGRHFNCGHFFALAAEGAQAEADYYRLKYADYDLLEVHAAFDDILDLTYEHNIHQAFREWIVADDDPLDFSYLQLLRMLVEIEEGGGRYTNQIGHLACRAGYQGILFFGARAIEPVREMINYGYNDDRMGLVTVHQKFREWRREPSFKNLVIFSGFNVTRSIRSLRLNQRERISNTLHRVDIQTLDALTEYNSEYQAEKLDRVVRISR
jgi:hypothetical protein